jgi:HD superfamily phosphohydrolase
LSLEPLSNEGVFPPGRVVVVESQRYTIGRYFNSGASGELYEVEGPGGTWALKLYIPPWNLLRNSTSATNLDWAALEKTLAMQDREHQTLRELHHPGVVRVIAADNVKLSKPEARKAGLTGASSVLPVIVTELIEGMDLENFLGNPKNLTAETLISVISGVARALDYVHEKKQMHCDVRLRNVMVRSSDNTPVLVDFAQAKSFDFDVVARDSKTLLLVDLATLPDSPLLHDFILKGRSGQLTREEVYADSFPTLDHVQFGRMLSRLLPPARTLLARSDWLYLELVAERLQIWGDGHWIGPLAERVGRLGGRGYESDRVPELREPTAHVKSLTLPGPVRIPLEGFVESVLQNRSFRRLGTINQLSLLNEVYPACDYKRSVHALYTYNNARKMATSLLETANFRYFMDSQSVRQLLAVALLHDINHFPFLHTVQETDLPGLDNKSVIQLLCDGDATGEKHRHEPSILDILGSVGVTQSRFVRLAYGHHEDQTSEVDQIINSILSSGADIDKMSYLQSDSYFTGVAFGGGIDTVELLASALIVKTDLGRLHLGYRETALQAVESLFMSRFWNFRSVYWHHTNRAIMAMVLDTVRRLYEDRKRPVTDFVAATKWHGEAQAIQWLDAQYAQHFGGPSILSGLLESRQRIFKRLYTVRPRPGTADKELFQGIVKQIGGRNSWQLELGLRQAIAEDLGAALGFKVGEEDVLIDIPRRGGLNDPGDAFIQGIGVKTLESLSPPVKHLRENYEELAQRVRFFIAPWIVERLEPGFREEKRKDIHTLISGAVKRQNDGVRGGVS